MKKMLSGVVLALLTLVPLHASVSIKLQPSRTKKVELNQELIDQASEQDKKILEEMRKHGVRSVPVQATPAGGPPAPGAARFGKARFTNDKAIQGFLASNRAGDAEMSLVHVLNRGSEPMQVRSLAPAQTLLNNDPALQHNPLHNVQIRDLALAQRADGRVPVVALGDEKIYAVTQQGGKVLHTPDLASGAEFHDGNNAAIVAGDEVTSVAALDQYLLAAVPQSGSQDFHDNGRHNRGFGMAKINADDITVDDATHFDSGHHRALAFSTLSRADNAPDRHVAFHENTVALPNGRANFTGINDIHVDEKLRRVYVALNEVQRQHDNREGGVFGVVTLRIDGNRLVVEPILHAPVRDMMLLDHPGGAVRQLNTRNTDEFIIGHYFDGQNNLPAGGNDLQVRGDSEVKTTVHKVRTMHTSSGKSYLLVAATTETRVPGAPPPPPGMFGLAPAPAPGDNRRISGLFALPLVPESNANPVLRGKLAQAVNHTYADPGAAVINHELGDHVTPAAELGHLLRATLPRYGDMFAVAYRQFQAAANANAMQVLIAAAHGAIVPASPEANALQALVAQVENLASAGAGTHNVKKGYVLNAMLRALAGDNSNATLGANIGTPAAHALPADAALNGLIRRFQLLNKQRHQSGIISLQYEIRVGGALVINVPYKNTISGNNVQDMFVVGDSVYVVTDGGGAVGAPQGIFKSTACFTPDGRIEGWGQFERVMGSQEVAHAGTLDPTTGSFYFLGGANRDEIKATYWGQSQVGAPNDTLSKLVEKHFPQEKGGVYKAFDFDRFTPGFAVGDFSMMVLVGGDTVMLVQTGRNAGGGYVPTQNFYDADTAPAAAQQNVFVFTPDGRDGSIPSPVLGDMAPLTCAEVLRDNATQNAGYLYVGGAKGIARLQQGAGNGWPSDTAGRTAPQQPGLGQLTAGAFPGIYTFARMAGAGAQEIENEYVVAMQSYDLGSLTDRGRVRIAVLTSSSIRILGNNGAYLTFGAGNNCVKQLQDDGIGADVIALSAKGKKALVVYATTKGVYVSFAIQGYNPDERDFYPLPGIDGTPVSLSYVSMEQGYNTKDGTLYLLTVDRGENKGRVYQFDVNAEALAGAHANENKLQRVGDYTFDLKGARHDIVADGSLLFHVRSGGISQHDLLQTGELKEGYKPSSVTAHLGLDAGDLLVSKPVRNSATGAWVLPGEFGVLTNE